ncbi:GntR family transcriptional regulator [Acuticoccus sp. M5D2P5]|uniref:GntR family transcriptional regulator n=1 Tax=Acuticoccus kalidii TaxID=2910977 RepID=UPI001F48820C|nr:GntR family transcriptional regulator [Acuticoccus kalidii]MCF3935185.1 GntR family transcriptional regulator [Acuticoccus kalidii]
MSTIDAIRKLPRLERDTLAARVHRDLRNLIMSGQIAPGDRLSLRATAEALGVSVMPVRDAVSRLVAEHALIVMPNRAIHVPLMTKNAFRELATIRAEIEGFAAETAALTRTEDDIREIAEADVRHRDACLIDEPDFAEAMRQNKNFHFAVYRAARLPQLVEIIESMWLRAGPVIILEAKGNPQWLAVGGATDRHRQALEAIETKDKAGARAAIARDIHMAAEVILDQGGLAD